MGPGADWNFNCEQTTPEMWRNSFTIVNLHSLTRIKLLGWTDKIKGLLIDGSIFKNLQFTVNRIVEFCFASTILVGVVTKIETNCCRHTWEIWVKRV